ncbi:MAG: hypothetical protein WCV55_02375 [Candidatus Paceibacterota bacterium]
MNYKEKNQQFLASNKKKWELFTPCFVINKKQLNSTVENIQRLLPGEIVYSHKTNPHPFITKTLNHHKCGFLLSSVEESEKIINDSGVDPEKLIFQSPSLTEKQYRKIKSLGISRFIIDSNDQLDLILSSFENMARKPEILVRINTGVTISHSELSYSTDSYLGFPMSDSLDVFKRLNELRKNNQITLGVHNHLLSQNTFPELWKKNVERITEFVETLRKNGVILDIVDFGGGYPIDYGKKITSFENIAKIITLATKKMKILYPDLHFIFEPGRKVVGESITLITRVIHVKEFLKTNVAILNCSVYNASMDTLIVDLFLPADKITRTKKTVRKYVIRGSTPDSLDVFAKEIKLSELKPGDHIAFFHAGAYSFWSDFISLRKPTYLVI